MMHSSIRQPRFGLLLLGALIVVTLLSQGLVIVLSGLGNLTQVRVVKAIEGDVNITVDAVGRVATVVDRLVLARLALFDRQYQDAAELLTPHRRYALLSPILYQDLIIAFGNSGQYQDSRALYEAAPQMLRANRQAMDAVAAAYLETLTYPDTASLLRAKAVRPDDLYTNYALWRDAVNRHDDTAAAVYRYPLARFTLQAVESANAAIVSKTSEIIPDLRSEGIWDHDTTSNAVSMLVWRYPKIAALETLLQEMIARYPLEPEWLYYLAEMYERRGDLTAAEATYKRVLEIDPGYAKAFLRLGTIAQSRAKDDPVAGKHSLEEAYGWLDQYHRMFPDDIVGFEMLANISATLELSNAVQLRTDLDNLTDDRVFVAEALGVPIDTVSIGTNLVENGNLLDWHDSSPKGWTLREYLGQDNNEGAYAVGRDDISPSGSSARIATLRGGVLSDGSLSYAEYSGDQFSIPGGVYLVSILHSADRFSEDSAVLVILGDYARPGGYVLLNRTIPSMNGQWRLERFLVHSESEKEMVGPLLRAWGDGQLKMLSFNVKPISLASE